MMQTLLNNSAEVLILMFLLITFFMSFIDKISDWRNQVTFLKHHFYNTFIHNYIPVTLVFIVVLEVFATIFCALGIYQLITIKASFYALIGCILSCVILLIFLLGQRIAKDFDGARNISIYFIIAVFGVYLFQ